MDTFECIARRRSVRSYTDGDLDEKAVDRILQAGRWAQSASNRQPWEFIIIRARETLQEIAARARYGSFIKDAPLAIAVVTNPETKWHIIDGSTAVQNMALAAWEMGIGTCWIGSLDREEVKELLGIPRELHLLTVLPFGYPEGTKESTRKDLDTMVHRERW